ncbi:MAG: STAS domain-containing protein [Solirubrobacterales bacterium]
MSATPTDDVPRFEITSAAAAKGARVVRIAGEIDIAHEEEVREALSSAIDEATAGVVVDLTDCGFIDSTGVRALLLGREAQREQEDEGRLAVAANSEQILRILSLMGVDKAIPVRPTVDEAIGELTG